MTYQSLGREARAGVPPAEAVVNFELVKVLPTFWPARRLGV